MSKFVFHRDKMGICVYYAGMNQGHRHTHGLTLNETVEFSSGVSAVVPEPARLSSVTIESETVGYINRKDNTKMTLEEHEIERVKLGAELSQAQANGDEEAEVRASIAKRKFEQTWEDDVQNVRKHTDFEFEIVDIDYPADERMLPLRHYGDEQINYFEIDTKEVIKRLAHSLCRGEGLKEVEQRAINNRTYSLSQHYGWNWYIEGKDYSDSFGSFRGKFTGTLNECTDYINSVEKVVRDAFDKWMVSGRSPAGMTVGVVNKHLDEIEGIVRRIDTKIKTRNAFNNALNRIHQAKRELGELAKAEMDAAE